MEIDYPAHLPRVMNVDLVQRSDGWRIQFVADTGDVWASDAQVFATKSEAQSFVNMMIDELQASHGAVVTRPT